MKRTTIAALACVLAMLGAPLRAQNIDRLQNLAQSEFRLLSEDLGGALSYHPQLPTEPLGVTGFDAGLAVTMARIRNLDVLKRASSDSVPSTVPIPMLRADKGLPLGFDVGALYSKVPGTDISFWGVQARYAILKGGVAQPAVGVRASYTKLNGVDELDLHTKGLDISASKGFAMFTPYIGVGRVWVNSDPHVSNLSNEDFGLNKVFIGAGFKLFLLNLNAEVDRTGPSTAYSLKAGIRF